jgi:uncharacterized membrane protein HdeD (DUF308 family)
MNKQTTPEEPRIDAEAVAALERLVPKSRQLIVTGVTMIVLGSAAVTVLAMSATVSLVPIGLILLVGALLELGVAHHAREEEGPITPWHRSGTLLALVGVAAVTWQSLPSILFTSFIGLSLMAAGWIRLRATSFAPLRQKSAIVPVAASLSILLGILLATRWAADSLTATGNLLSLELIVTGWGFVGLGLTLGRMARN